MFLAELRSIEKECVQKARELARTSDTHKVEPHYIKQLAHATSIGVVEYNYSIV